MTIGYLDGFGGNPWRETVKAEFENEASFCPNLKTLYVDANLNPQAYQSDINSLVARGVNAIVTYDDFGTTMVPAIQHAFKQGVPVVANEAEISPTAVAGQDYTGVAKLNAYAVGQAWGRYLSKQLHGHGNVIYLWGTPGNQEDPEYLAGFRSTAAPGLKLLDPTSVPTNWDIGKTKQVASGFISKYPRIDALMSSYGAAAVEALQTFLSLGKPIPALATISSSNQLVCFWHEHHQGEPSFQVFTEDGGTNIVRIALREAVAAAQHKKDPEPDYLTLAPFIDTSAGKIPACQSSLPAGADPSSDLSVSQQKAIFGG